MDSRRGVQLSGTARSDSKQQATVIRQRNATYDHVVHVDAIELERLDVVQVLAVRLRRSHASASHTLSRLESQAQHQYHICKYNTATLYDDEY